MLGLETGPGHARKRDGRDTGTIAGAQIHLSSGSDHVILRSEFRGMLQDFIGMSIPCWPPGTTMLVQVPPWTNFHALPWKSIVDVPWRWFRGRRRSRSAP